MNYMYSELKRRSSGIYWMLIVLVLLSSCNTKSGREGKKEGQKLIVFAAASVTDIMQEVARRYKEKTGIEIRLNLASSGILARQMEQGSPCDVYISASKNWMDYALEKGVIKKESHKVLAQNQMVAVAPVESNLESMEFNDDLDLPGLFRGRLSLGDPKHVPAGMYAMEVLKYYGWDEALTGRLLPAKDVRDALMVVELGEAELGMVYASDAQKSRKVKQILKFPVDACSPIQYYGGIGNEAQAKAVEFLTFLAGKEMRELWLKNGFIMKN